MQILNSPLHNSNRLLLGQSMLSTVTPKTLFYEKLDSMLLFSFASFHPAMGSTPYHFVSRRSNAIGGFRSALMQMVTREHSTPSPDEDYQEAVETSRSTSHVTTSWDKRLNSLLLLTTTMSNNLFYDKNKHVNVGYFGTMCRDWMVSVCTVLNTVLFH